MNVAQYILAIAALASSAVAQALFQPLERNHFEPDPGSIDALVLIDVDGDGHLDLLLRAISGTQSWYRNDGHGAFTARPLSLPGADLRASHAVSDVDGDGRQDLVLGGVLYRNLGGGTFQPDPAAVPAAAGGADLETLVDLDGDGHPDLLARAAGSLQHLCAFRNDGTGHFTDISNALPFATAAVLAFAVTDADRDGDLDVVAIFAGPGAQLLRNDGRAHFTATALPALPPAATSLSAGDLDQDGSDDLCADGILFRNDGTGTYTQLTSLVYTQPLQQVNIARAQLVDVDGDGRADLVNADGWNGWFHNEGAAAPGTFSFFLSWFAPFPWGGAAPLQYADLDGDLDLDAVAAGGRPRLLFNTGGEFHDAVQESVVLAPQRPQPLREADARVYSGPGPFTELAYVDNGVAMLLTGRTPAIAPSFPGAYGGVFMPVVNGCTSVALCDLDGRADYSLVACTPQGGRLLLRVGPWTLYDRTDLLHWQGTPVSVACGRVSGGLVDDVVLGAAGVDGPQILTVDAAGHLRPLLPVLPPPSAPFHPLNELVRLYDFDGDGDLDILHELRIVRNDGNLTFSLGPDFSALVPPDAVGLAVLDFDLDGLADLVIWSTSTPLRLLRNLGTSFADVSAAHLPPGLGVPTSVAVGDVDRDGDPDLLLGNAGRASLLRNDHGQFVLVPDVGPEGVLVDMDGDLDPDLFDGARIHHNLHAQLHAPRLPTLGADYRLDVHCWPGAQPTLGVLAVGSRAGYFDSPFLGPLRLDPASAVAVGVTLGNGVASVAMPIPRSPLFLGTGFFTQAAILDGNRLHCTNDLHETIR